MKITIIGAGPGGLASAMLLASAGHEVHIYEKESHAGGRNARFEKDGFFHDYGPTFIMWPQFLDEIFYQCGEKVSDYINLQKLDTMYRLTFPSDKKLDLTTDTLEMRRRIEEVFPGESKGYDAYMKREGERLEHFVPCFKKPYSSVLEYAYPTTVALYGHLDITKSVHDVLSTYFHDEEIKLAFSFQSKYLGMSPFVCPGAFTMLAYMEHAYGIWHAEGWLAALSLAMETVAKKKWAHFHYSAPVEKVLVKNGKAIGVRVNGKDELSDRVVINADFSHAMSTLFEPQDIKKWAPKKLEKKKYSCSTYMILGLDTIYRDEPHHNIVFARDYHQNIADINAEKPALDNPSIYIRNASVTDATLAPEGKSEMYILVPVSNTRAGVDWEKESPAFRDQIIRIIEERTGMKDLSAHIVSEMILTPDDWEQRGVYIGATFNLAHSLDQMLAMRPHNEFECVKGVYLVGGGTHPGSGLPTIYASAQIVTNLIGRKG